jgi:NAD(P)-dependent dehydrogenase (short-subunit alcohol dehydrogenase family)
MAGAARGRAVVTGAASGIGRATAYRLAEDGFAVVALDLDPAGLAVTGEEVVRRGGTATTAEVDLRDPAAIERVLTAVLADGAPAVLANVAGMGVAAELADTTTAQWDEVLAVDLSAVFHTCRVVLPAMLAAGGGIVVNVSSVAGVVGIARRAAYCAAKAGVIGLTRATAADYAARGIRANAICPGTVATEWIGKILADAPDPEATRRAMEARQLDGRMGSPEEVAAGIAFLCSPEARFVNGSAFVMDGGMTAV